MKKRLSVFTLALTSLLTSSTFGQSVGIGGTFMPDSSSVLQVISPIGKHKGMLIPAMNQAQRDSIVKPANGLIIYNVDEDCFNYYDSAQAVWISVCGGTGAAKFEFICNSIAANGTYVTGTPLTGANYLSVPIHVSKPGSFSILGVSGNGYSFSYSSVVTDTGTVLVNVPGLGNPISVQTDKVMINGATDTCYANVTVQTNVATYSLDCASAVVNGNYIKGTPLTSTGANANTITLRVTVSSGGYYNISTPLTNGVQFTCSGVFDALTAGTSQPVTLLPTTGSVPTVNQDFPITINANSPAGNVTCSATIPITLPAMKYALIGTDSWFSWTSARKPALQNGASFGLNGTVRIVSLTEAWETNSAATATTNITANTPDIIMYFAYSAPVDANLIAALKKYVNAGGVLIYASSSSDLSSAQQLVSGLFPGITPAAMPNCNSGACPANYPNDDNCYMINYIPGDPVVNGPFGNLGGKYWAEDNGTTGTFYIPQLPSGAVQICSAMNNWGHTNLNPNWSVVWYSNSSNFFYFGDTDGASATDTTTGSFPALYSSTGIPLTKQYGNGDNANSPYVYVSALELNAVAWGLHKAAVSGINPH